MMKQKDVFLESEGDAWFARNAAAVHARPLPQSDPLLMEILELSLASGEDVKILEIGCGDGTRLQWLKSERRFSCHGVEPSAQAVKQARAHGIHVTQGTAEKLPFEDGAFDVVIFGFCLYLVDREDLLRVACEGDRVLKNPGWLLIHDFYSPVPLQREYHHRLGLFSHKMDYRALFDCHRGYATLTHKVRHHATGAYTDDPGQWVATSVLRQNLNREQ